MKTTTILIGLFLLVAVTGCDTMRFTQYTGSTKAWPAGSAFSEKVFAVPMYRGWPEKPYEIIGYVEFTNPGVNWNEGDMKQAAAEARKAGGDAIIMIPKAEATSPTLVTVRNDVGAPNDRTVALVLKWK